MQRLSIDPRYSITTDGRICNHTLGRFLKLNTARRGYVSVRLNRKTYAVHRLVAEAYIANPDSKPCVNHLNGVKSDNRVENLEWVSHSENTRHSLDVLGNVSSTVGLLSGRNKKLSIEQAEEIRQLKGIMRYADIAKMYRVTNSCIAHIMTNRTYISTN